MRSTLPLPQWITHRCGLTNETNNAPAKFSIGHLVVTRGWAATFPAEDEWCRLLAMTWLARRHVAGDWSEMDPQDRQENEWASQNGERILSSFTYTGADGEPLKVWVITESDRSTTTILLPEEY